MIFPFSSHNRNYRAGLALAAGQSFDEAAKRLAEAARLQPDDARTQLQYGLALSEAGQYEDAVIAIEKAMALDPDVAVFPMFLGAVHFDAKELESARELFDQASRLDSKNALTQNYSALLDWVEGDRREAAKKLLEIDFIQSCQFEARLLFCVEHGFPASQDKESLLNESGLTGEGIYFASPDASPWIKAYRKWRMYRCTKKAATLSARGKFEKAVFRLEEALELAPQDQSVRDAIREARQGWIQDLQKKRKKEGKESELSLEIGCLLWQNGEPGRSEPMVTAWLDKHLALDEKERDPFRMGAAYRVLCGIAIAARQAKQADERLKKLKEIDPHDPFVHYLEGRCAVLDDDARRARHAFERFLAWEPAFGRIRLREWLFATPETGGVSESSINAEIDSGEEALGEAVPDENKNE